jgi:hypothetical protein
MLLHHPILAIAHLLDGLDPAKEAEPKNPREKEGSD